MALVALALLSVSCEPAESEAAEKYVAAWVDSWTAGDPYDLARFYHPDVEIRLAHPDLELTNGAGFTDTTTDGTGRAWFVSWLDGHTKPHDWVLITAAIDDHSAVVALQTDDITTAIWVELVVDRDGTIVEQTTLRWRDAHKPGGTPDPELDWVDQLVADYLAGWSGDGALLESWYLPSAGIATSQGLGRFDADHATLQLQNPRLVEVRMQARNGPALFVVPGGSTDAVGFFFEEGGCGQAVLLQMDERLIASERRFAAAACSRAAELSPWSRIGIPVPLEQQVTAVVDVGELDVTIHSGSADMAQLVRWGLERFAAAGLDAPSIESVTFAPNHACHGLAGQVIDNADGSRDIVACTDAHEACTPDRAICSGFALTARLTLLHEIAHVWLLENADDATQQAFMDERSLQAWRDDSLPWYQRGAEQAAEILAWGLMDDPFNLVRIGSPTCSDAAAGFVLLTGAEPLQRCV